MCDKWIALSTGLLILSGGGNESVIATIVADLVSGINQARFLRIPGSNPGVRTPQP